MDIIVVSAIGVAGAVYIWKPILIQISQPKNTEESSSAKSTPSTAVTKD